MIIVHMPDTAYTQTMDWLLGREHDIADGMEDLGGLVPLFVLLVGRMPEPLPKGDPT